MTTNEPSVDPRARGKTGVALKAGLTSTEDGTSYPDRVTINDADFRKLVERTLKQQGVSAIRAARSAGLNRDAIRSVLRGRSPSLERTLAICTALGLDFHIGGGNAATAVPNVSDGATRPGAAGFTSGSQLEVVVPGRTNPRSPPARAPAPKDLRDAHAFYAVAADSGLAPAGVLVGDYCLVSPLAELPAWGTSVLP